MIGKPHVGLVGIMAGTFAVLALTTGIASS